MEERHHPAPINAINEDAPGHHHEDFLCTVSLNLVDQSGRRKNSEKNRIIRYGKQHRTICTLKLTHAHPRTHTYTHTQNHPSMKGKIPGKNLNKVQ